MENKQTRYPAILLNYQYIKKPIDQRPIGFFIGFHDFIKGLGYKNHFRENAVWLNSGPVNLWTVD